MANNSLAKNTVQSDPQPAPLKSAELVGDISQQAIKNMIAEAKERGYVTYDKLNEILPPEQVSSEQIEDVMSLLHEMDINVIENEEIEEAEAEAKSTALSGPGTFCSRHL